MLLDLEMPVMDGMTALPLLLGLVPPRPAVIVASALTQRGAAAAMAALRAGAVDYVPKPGAAGGGLADPRFQAELLAKVRGWARMASRPRAGAAASRAAPHCRPRPATAARGRRSAAPRVIGIGCSTGGPQALSALVGALGAGAAAGAGPGRAAHAGRLHRHARGSPGPPRRAALRRGEGTARRCAPGRLYLAPGDRHLLVEAAPGGALVARLSDGPPENFCRPAVDPMLRSLVAACGGRVLAAILTGMGQDGLAGCRAVAAAGGAVLAQDEASSVVWGMPGAVAKAGLAQACCRRRGSRRRSSQRCRAAHPPAQECGAT